MAVTMDQVLRYLQADEVKYDEAAHTLGPDAAPILIDLIKRPDANIASKAAYLAGLIPSTRSAEALSSALQHREPAVRVAGVAALAHLAAEAADPLLQTAMRDQDAGVRRIAVETLPARISPTLRSVLNEVAQRDPDPGLRVRSTEVLKNH
jgi:HEAT repeat protein